MNNYALRILSIFIVLIAIIQIYGIGEMVFSAFWIWLKFYGSGGIDGITIGTTMTAITVSVSLIVIATSYAIRNKSEDKFVLVLSKYSMYSLLVGLVCLIVLLASPLAYFYSR